MKGPIEIPQKNVGCLSYLENEGHLHDSVGMCEAGSKSQKAKRTSGSEEHFWKFRR